jgi:ribose transport system permease protein
VNARLLSEKGLKDGAAASLGPTTDDVALGSSSPRRQRAKPQTRFIAIWVALATLLVVGRVWLPQSVEASTLLSILPFAAFLACAAMGQAIVLMGRGIDLSPPAIIALSSTVLLGVSGGSDDRLWLAIALAVLAALAVGAVNGVLVALIKLNALIVTMSVGAITSGLTLWYRQSLAAESKVPRALANFGSAWFLGMPTSVWIIGSLTIAIVILMRKTVVGRKFEAVGANPRAAHATGIEVVRYQAGSFVVAALLYAVTAILLSAFIRNPTLEVGGPYLLGPIAAAVLGGTAIGGGIGNMFAVAGAAMFLIQLDHSLKMLGVPTSYQLVIQGAAIAVGMWLSGASIGNWMRRRPPRNRGDRVMDKAPKARSAEET